MGALHPLQGGGVTVQGVGEVSIHATLGINREEAGRDIDAGHAGESVGTEYRRKSDITQSGIIVSLAWRGHPIHAESVCPKLIGSDRPVILQAAILHVGLKDHAIAGVAEVAAANDGGRREYIVMPAVTSANFVVRRNLMIELNVALSPRGNGCTS